MKYINKFKLSIFALLSIFGVILTQGCAQNIYRFDNGDDSLYMTVSHLEFVGSGVPIEYKGQYYILTAAHIISKELDSLEYVSIIKLNEGIDVGKIKKIDRYRDLCIISSKKEDFVKWYKVRTKPLSSQDLVFNVGFPYYTGGKKHIVVSNIDGIFILNGTVETISFPGRVVSGCSGGAIFDQDFKVAGILTKWIFTVRGFGPTNIEILEFLEENAKKDLANLTNVTITDGAFKIDISNLRYNNYNNQFERWEN